MANYIEKYHETVSKSRRAVRLAETFASLIPENASVLDVGTGDGSIAATVQNLRPDVQIQGLEFQVRADCAIPVQEFDGMTIPLDDDSVDYVSFLDVLHHTDDVRVLLKEATRVARRGIILKDHLVAGLLARTTLAFMDRVGNARYQIPLPYNYLPQKEWEAVFEELSLEKGRWETTLKMYPWWADWLFGRGLHFFARLEKVKSNA